MKSWTPIIVFFLSIVIGLLFFGKAHAEDLPAIDATLSDTLAITNYVQAQTLAPPPIIAGPIGHPSAMRLELENGRTYFVYWDGYQMDVKEITPRWKKFWLWFNGIK